MSNLKLATGLPLTKELDNKLNRHFVACSAFVGTAALMSATKADAGIAYSGTLNYDVPTTNIFGGIYFDLTRPNSFFIPSTSGAGPAEGLNTVLPGWDFNFYKGSVGLRWYYNTGALAVSNSVGHAAALSAGVMVDASSALGTRQTMYPEFTSTTAFMGVRFLDDASNVRYGWIRITGGPDSGIPATVVDWAYETSGAGILTGAVPEPSAAALGCLAAGAAGIAAWRRRKAN